jgi:ATP-dependent DNA ligase
MSLHPPGFIEPCLPTGSRTAPTGPQWAYEIKHDGFRFIIDTAASFLAMMRSYSLLLCRPAK